MKPLVSVIVPTYNRADRLSRAIDSILTQTFTDFELILVDDASTDDTADVIKKWTTDPRFRYLKLEKNGGAARARNAGIRAAAGKYIAFQDSDDRWLPNKLEIQMALLDTPGEEFGMVTGTLLRPLHGGGVLACPWHHVLRADGLREVRYQDIATQYFAHVQTLVLRADCLAVTGVFDEKVHASEDWDLLLRFARHFRIVDCGQPVTVAYYGDDRLTLRADLRTLDLQRIFEKHASEMPPEAAAHTAYMAALAYCETGQLREARVMNQKALEFPVSHPRARILQMLLVVPPLARALIWLVRVARYCKTHAIEWARARTGSINPEQD